MLLNTIETVPLSEEKALGTGLEVMGGEGTFTKTMSLGETWVLCFQGLPQSMNWRWTLSQAVAAAAPGHVAFPFRNVCLK